MLVSFSIVSDDFAYKTPLAYMNLMETVVFDDYQVEVSILGLRSLQSVGILPVKKAFIQFNLKSLVPPTCAQKVDNIKTAPGPAGPDPTINTMIKFTIPLPGDPLYCPRLQCSVFDNIFKGFMQPLLGVFTIPIGDILLKKTEERKKEAEGLDHILDELSKMLEGMGIQSYTSVQEKKVEEMVEDVTFRSVVQQQKEQVEQVVLKDKQPQQKKDIKQQLFAPLLLNIDSDDRNSDDEFYSHSHRTPSKGLTPVNQPLNKVAPL